MSRIICTSDVKVKSSRRTARPAAPFGAGVFARFQPSAADQAWAAQAFGVDADWDVRLAAGVETCECCGRPVELGGLCDACETRAEEATMASLYYGAGLGYATA